MVEQQQLGDEPAHAPAEHVGARDVVGVQHGQRIGRERGHAVVDLVGFRARAGPPGVAVVVADHRVVGGQRREERLGPQREGRARIGHEEHGVGRRARMGLRPQRDAGCGVDEPRHPYSVHPPAGARTRRALGGTWRIFDRGIHAQITPGGVAARPKYNPVRGPGGALPGPIWIANPIDQDPPGAP